MSRHAVHQLRTAIRRLLACLELLGAAQNDRPAVQGLLLRQLKALGALRDVQVQLQCIKEEPRLASALQPLHQHLQRRKLRREKAAGKALRCDKAVHRLQRWRLLPVRKDSHLIPRLRQLMDDKLEQAFDPLGAFSHSTPVDSATRHRLRVVSREYRYMVEALRPGWCGGEASRLVSNLQAYHEIIGQLHDRELLLHRIDRLIANEKLAAVPVRPFRARLQTEKTKLLKACAQLDRWMFHEAMLARRHLHQNLPCN